MRCAIRACRLASECIPEASACIQIAPRPTQDNRAPVRLDRKHRGQNEAQCGNSAETLYEVTRFVNQGAWEIDPNKEMHPSPDFGNGHFWRRWPVLRVSLPPLKDARTLRWTPALYTALTATELALATRTYWTYPIAATPRPPSTCSARTRLLPPRRPKLEGRATDPESARVLRTAGVFMASGLSRRVSHTRRSRSYLATRSRSRNWPKSAESRRSRGDLRI